MHILVQPNHTRARSNGGAGAVCANLRISETPRRSATLRLVAEGTDGPLFVVFDNMVRVLMIGDLRAKKCNISPAFGQVFSH